MQKRQTLILIEQDTTVVPITILFYKDECVIKVLGFTCTYIRTYLHSIVLYTPHVHALPFFGVFHSIFLPLLTRCFIVVVRYRRTILLLQMFVSFLCGFVRIYSSSSTYSIAQYILDIDRSFLVLLYLPLAIGWTAWATTTTTAIAACNVVCQLQSLILLLPLFILPPLLLIRGFGHELNDPSVKKDGRREDEKDTAVVIAYDVHIGRHRRGYVFIYILSLIHI